MRIPLKLVTPPSLQRFDCQGCRECCRDGFSVALPQDEQDRIVGLAWDGGECDVPIERLFNRAGNGWELMHRPDGRCVFLQDDGLLLTYPIICWFARAFALGEGLSTPNAACVERALMVVNHQHGVTPFLDIPTERSRMKFLCAHETFRSLVIWYWS